MKQLLLRKGKVSIEDVPAPQVQPNHVLVEVSKSLISTGTEMASVSLSGASLVSKAKQRPQEVKKVLNSIRVRGLKKTFSLVQGKLDESKPLGYSCSGVVIAAGKNVKHFQKGDRVACAGATLANHAEVVSVPSNLVTKVPNEVSDESASFVTLGAIALQGVRRAQVQLGETVCVSGLGLLGQITVQLLRSAGCRVIGFDPDPARVQKAIDLGLNAGTSNSSELNEKISALTSSMGVDATIITASTASHEPANNAFEITRKKGRIVVVGAVGMNLNRSPFYEKEQDFLISCSYGPGRYDPEYENEGKDYPYAFVRWTENRNMQAFLELIRDNRMDVETLIDKVYPLKEAVKAYDELNQKNGKKPLAVVLSCFDEKSQNKQESIVKVKPIPSPKGVVRVGLIGVGNFAKTTHIPNLQKLGGKVSIQAVCSANGASGKTVGRQVKASLITTDYQALLREPDIDAVVISTRHDKHAVMAEDALKAGKHVFLEKPLALTIEELESLQEVVESQKQAPVFMVGFNRRFAPGAKKLKAALKDRVSPVVMVYRVNAGRLPANHWTKTEEGGGRLRGEACHMVDFFRAMVGQSIQSVSIDAISTPSQVDPRADENFSLQVRFVDGSIGTLIYTALGNKNVSKEYVELHWDGKTALLNDFSYLEIHGSKASKHKTNQDKGHAQAMNTFVEAIHSGNPFPIPWSQLVEVTQSMIELDRDLSAENID